VILSPEDLLTIEKALPKGIAAGSRYAEVLKWRIWIVSGEELLIGSFEADDTRKPPLLSYRYVVVPKGGSDGSA
jgi:hypothetical protein